MNYRIKLLSAAILVSLTVTGSARADSLDAAVGEMAKKLSAYLQSKGESSISIGQFVGPPNTKVTSSAGLARLFEAAFKKHQIQVAARAKTGLLGKYILIKEGIRIEGSLVDQFGETLTDFTVDGAGLHQVVDEPEEVAQLLGATTSLHPSDRQDDRAKDLKKHILNPPSHIDGTKFSAADSSPYSVEVIVSGRPLPIKTKAGLGFCEIKRGDAYIVRVHNNSDFDAAVKVAIDGLNIFTFSDMKKPDGSPRYSFYIVPAHSSFDFKGWHKNNSKVTSFLVTGYDKSAAATLDHKQDIGTITATFAAAWPKDGPPPPDESASAKGAGNATGFGAVVNQKVREVQRVVGKLRASISVRYAK